MIPRCAVGAVGFTVLPLRSAVDMLLARANGLPESGHPGIGVHFANAYNVALARSNADYAAILNAADFVFSDGVPITWVGKRAYPQHASEWERVYGPDAMTLMLSRSGNDRPRHYLLGSTSETMARLTANIAERFPHAHIAGFECPPFQTPSAADLAARDERIRASGANMVWVGLGTPKQDVEVSRLASALPVMALAVGAAFDFLAGTRPQAPSWMQGRGLEWAYRLGTEPRRLGKRYLWGNSVFLLEAARTLRDR